MNLKSIWIPAIASMAILTGCTVDDIPGPDAKELYTREFVKKFGPHSMQSDCWNLVRQASVTVSALNPTDVKVYYETSGRRYLCADYRQITGLETITVDVPADVNNLIVRSNGHTYNAPIGSRLDLGGREIPSGSVTTKLGEIEYAPTEEPVIFSRNVIKEFINALTEEGNNLNVSVDGKPIISNFSFVGTGEPITIYPLYWNTSSFHALGIYWLKDGKTFASYDEEHDRAFMQDIYYTRTGELDVSTEGKTYYVRCWSSGELSEGDICQVHQLPVNIVKEGDSFKMVDYSGSDVNFDSWPFKPDLGTHYHKVKRGETEFIACSDLYPDPGAHPAAYEIDEISKIRTRGITLTVPEGVRFGFYLRVHPGKQGKDGSLVNPISSDRDVDETDHIVFSQAARNTEYGQTDSAWDWWECSNQYEFATHQWTDAGSKNKTVFASYTTLKVDGTDYTYFAFEDWNIKGPDLNDVVFIMDTDGPQEDGVPNVTVVDEDKPEDPEPTEEWSSWLLAAEDLGNGDAMGDWDFNDMVVKISTCVVKEGEADAYTSVLVTPLASGGTIPVYLMYTGELQGPGGVKENGTYWIGGREFHSWLRPGVSFTSPLNVGRGSTVGDGHYCKNPASLTIPGKFTLTSHNNGVISADMNGFWFVADKENTMRWNATDKDYTAIDASTLPHDITKIVAPDVDNKEIAAPQMICVDNDWCWPHEGKPIDEAYTSFLRNTSTGWYRGANGHLHDNSGVVIRSDLDCHK